jgi:hypothetical protein
MSAILLPTIRNLGLPMGLEYRWPFGLPSTARHEPDTTRARWARARRGVPALRAALEAQQEHEVLFPCRAGTRHDSTMGPRARASLPPHRMPEGRCWRGGRKGGRCVLLRRIAAGVQGGRGGYRGAPLAPPLLRHGGRIDASRCGRSPPPL